MRCEDLLSTLETAGWTQRLLARRHANGCPKCATTYRAWSAAKKDLAQAEPLSPELRRLWTSAVREVIAQPLPAKRSQRIGWVAATMCLAVMLCWGAWKVAHLPPGATAARKPPSDSTKLVKSPQKSARVPHAGVSNDSEERDPSGEFARLELRIKDLDAELTGLAQEAERLEARQEAAEMLDRYSKWQF